MLLLHRSVYELWGCASNYEDLQKAVEQLPGGIMVRATRE